MGKDIERAYELFKPYLPEGTTLHIEQTDGKLIAKYIYRLTYTSVKSGRKLTILSKGDSLPTEDDACLKFYLRQIVLDKKEIAAEFNRVYLRERYARQDAWLFSGGKSRGNSVMVIDGIGKSDSLEFNQTVIT